MITLGIESSCDDTSVAVVRDGIEILSNVISSQIEVHRRFGGVVPEVASRKHLEAMLPIMDQALKEAGVTLDAVDQVAVTAGPGLLGPLLVGLAAAKAVAWRYELPLIPVNHLEAHLTAAFLSQARLPQWPFLGLIVSGGHSNLVYSTGPRTFEILGRTLDDAPGELFDKIARHLGLGYPGGPEIQRHACLGNPEKFVLPRPMFGKGFDFSFSGLKTAAIRSAGQSPTEINVSDLCAALQKAVSDIFAEKVTRAVSQTKAQRLVVAGGVAANTALRAAMSSVCNGMGIELIVPPAKLCTDNAAMIAGHGFISADCVGSDNLKTGASAVWQMGGALPA